MRDRSKTIIRLLILAAGVACECFASDGNQVWLDFDVGKIISDRTSVHGKQSLRWTDGVDDLSVSVTDIGVRSKVSSWLTLGLFFREQLSDYSDNGWSREERPYLDAIIKWKLSAVQFSARNRLEYRMREGRDDSVRYRFKLTELSVKELTPLQLRPYLAQEFFVEEGDGFFESDNRIRFFIGIRRDPEDRFQFLGLRPKKDRKVKTDLFVMYETEDRDMGWRNACVVGLKWGMFF